MRDEVGCEIAAKSETGEEGTDSEILPLHEEENAGGGTRTPDTRIMIPLL
jgi:hypothetical protein